MFGKFRAQSHNEVSILVIGRTGVGKTTFVKAATKFASKANTGDGPTQDVRPYVFQSKVEGHIVRVIDTPGFDDANAGFEHIYYNRILPYLENEPKNKQVTGIVYVHNIHQRVEQIEANLNKLEELGKRILEDKKACTDRKPAGKNAESGETQHSDPIDRAALANVLVICTSFDLNPSISQYRFDKFKSHEYVRRKEKEGYIFATAGPEDQHEYTLQTVIERSMDKLILVMGGTGAGKTTFINAVTKSGFRVGHGLQSCTSDVKLSKPISVRGQRIKLIDTPGFDDTNRTDADILRDITVFLGASYQNKDHIIGVLYLHDINGTRMGGTAVRNIQIFNETVGAAAAKNVVILTTQWDLIATELGNQRYAELKAGPNLFGNITGLGAIMAKSWKKAGQDNRDMYNNILQTIVERSMDRYILVIGPTGAGKTTFISNIAKPGSKTIDSQGKIRFSDAIEIGNHSVTLIDTPGFGDTDDIKVLEYVGEELERNCKRKEQIIGIIYVQDAASLIKPSKILDPKALEQLVGEAAAKDVVVITTKWNTVDPHKGALLERSLREAPDFFVNGATVLQSIIQQSVSLNEQSDFILVMGGAGTGKTKLINSLTDSKLREGNGTTKCTLKCGFSDQLQLPSYMLKFIDTPGLEPDADNEAIYKEIRTTAEYLKGNRIIGGIYMLDPALLKARGSACKVIQTSIQLISEVTSGNAVVLATSQTPTDNKQLEDLRTNSYFAPLLKKGVIQGIYRGSEQSTHIIHMIIKSYEKTEVLRIQKEYVDERKQVKETSAGVILDKDLQRASEEVDLRHREQLEDLENQRGERSSREIKDMKAALKQAKQRREQDLAKRRKTLKQQDPSGGGISFGLNSLMKRIPGAGAVTRVAPDRG